MSSRIFGSRWYSITIGKMMNLIAIGLLVLAIVMMSGCIKSETAAPTQSPTIERPLEKVASTGSIIKVNSNTKFELGIGDMVNFTNYQDISFRLMKLNETEVILDVIFSPTTEIGQPYGGWGPNPELYPNLNITEKTPTTLYREVRECGTDKLKLDPQMIILDGFYMNYVCESRKQQHCYEDGSFDQYYNEKCEYGQTGNVRQLTLPIEQSYALINIKDKISSIIITYLGISSEKKAKFATKEENQRPTTTPAATPTVTPKLTYPDREEVKKYVADLKKVPQDEVKIIDFQNIGAANMIPTRAYHSGGYVAVSVIITNYTSLVMAYKNYNDVINIGDHTASTDEEKKIFDLLMNITYDHNGPFDGNLIPTNITIINSSYTMNKNEKYQINSTYNLPTMANPYASFKFVTKFNGFHGYWPESYGWLDAKTKQIWIQMLPQV